MAYIGTMEVSITKLRRDLFAFMNHALEGQELWVTYKGRRLRIVPEIKPGGRLSRITPIEVVDSEFASGNSGGSDRALQEEMKAAWERDWSDL